jgi:hypothetical protein
MATYYLTITPINTLSTSTYSIYFDEVKYSNLMLSGVPQSELVAGKLVYFTGSAASATSVYVKNEDPDCCCAVQSYILPTPSPTTAPTTAAPTTAAPTTAAPTTAAPTTAAPTTAAPTITSPTTSSPTTSAPTTASPTGPTYYTIDVRLQGRNGSGGNLTILQSSDGIFYSPALQLDSTDNQYVTQSFNGTPGYWYKLLVARTSGATVPRLNLYTQVTTTDFSPGPINNAWCSGPNDSTLESDPFQLPNPLQVRNSIVFYGDLSDTCL